MDPHAPAPSQTPAAATPPPASQVEMPAAPPSTPDQLVDLLARRSQLSAQYSSASSQRSQLSRELRGVGNSDAVDRAGLEQRIANLDHRIEGIAAQKAVLDQQVAAAPARLYPGGTGPALTPPGFDLANWAPASVAIALIVLGPLSFALARRLLRRPHAVRMSADPAAVERLERIEHAVETIAIEVERVSESQRFITRVLTERHATADIPNAQSARSALPAGEAPFEPLRVNSWEAVG